MIDLGGEKGPESEREASNPEKIMLSPRCYAIFVGAASLCVVHLFSAKAIGYRSVLEIPPRSFAFGGGAPTSTAPVPPVSANTAVAPDTSGPISKQAIYNDSCGYLRVTEVSSGLGEAVGKALRSMQATNEIKGLVLDLRFAGGKDSLEIAKIADLFCAESRLLMKAGETELRSTAKTDSFQWPVAVLVNRETSAGAEALAGVLSDLAVGIVIGNGTAGEPFGEAGSPRWVLPSGQPVPESGVKPDVHVAIAPIEERLYLENPYRTLRRATNGLASEVIDEDGSTNNRPQPFNESELVKRHRAGTEGAGGQPERARPSPPAAGLPAIADPVLARGLDFVKGFPVLRISRSAP
jgi:Peptidase family S41